MTRTLNPHKLDIVSFARDAASLSGQGALQTFARVWLETPAARISQATAGQVAKHLVVQWHAQGEFRGVHGAKHEVWLHVQVQCQVPLSCQRCMDVVDVPVVIDRSFRFAPDEETAAALDEEFEEDVLVLSHEFNLLELIEDEILLELPLVPRHEQCPKPPKMQATDPEFDDSEESKPNPFAALAAIQTGKKR